MFHSDRIARLAEKVSEVEAHLCLMQNHVEDIKTFLTSTFERIENLMADRGALDTAIATLGTETANLANLASNSIAKAQKNAPTIDYSSELAELAQIKQNIANAVGGAQLAAASEDVSQASTIAQQQVAKAQSQSATANAPIPSALTQPSLGQQEAAELSSHE